MCSFPIQLSSYKVLVDFSFSGSFAPSFQCRVGDSRLALWEQQVLCLRTHTYADQKHPQVQDSLGQRLFPCLSVFPKHISTLYWSVTLLNAITLSSSSLVGKLSNKYLLLFSFLFLPHIHKVRKKSQCLSALCWNPAASDVQLSSGSESPSWLSNLTQQPGICVVSILAVVLSFEGIMLGFITPFSRYQGFSIVPLVKFHQQHLDAPLTEQSLLILCCGLAELEEEDLSRAVLKILPAFLKLLSRG